MNFPQKDQVAASTILNFFSGLHGLVYFAECANEVAISVQKGLRDENPIFDTTFYKGNESGALRLTRTACNALARGAGRKKMENFRNLTFSYKIS